MPNDALLRLREKYPEYQTVPDQELARRVIEKYPDYQDALGDVASGASPSTTEPNPASSKVRENLIAAGAIAGGMGGAALGAPAGGIGAIPGGIAGAGLGAAGVSSILNLISPSEKPKTFGGEIAQAGGEALQGATLEMAGGVAGKGLSTVLGVGGRTTGFLSREISEAALKIKNSFDRLGIPYRAADILGSKAVGRIENIPTYFAFGIGPVQRFAERQVIAAQNSIARTIGKATDPLAGGKTVIGAVADKIAKGADAAEAMMDRVFHVELKKVDQIVTGLATRGNFQKSWQAFKEQKNQVFDAIGEMAGPQPQVRKKNLEDAASQLLDQAGILPISPPAGTAKFVPKEGVEGLGKDFVEIGDRVFRKDQLPPALSAAVEELGGIQGELIPFSIARKIESQLGEIGYGKASALFPGARNANARFLYKAVGKDIEEFLDSRSDVDAALAAGKQFYKTGRRLFESATGATLANPRIRDAQVLGKIFKPGDVESTLEFQQLVSDATYEKAQTGLLASLFDRAGGDFKKLSSLLKQYEINDHMKIIFPDQYKAIQSFMNIIENMPRSAANELAVTMGRNVQPEQIISRVLRPGDMTDTMRFAKSVNPKVFDDSVNTLLADLYKQSFSSRNEAVPGQMMLSANKFASAIEPYIRSGQLDLMLKRQPEKLARIKDSIEVFRKLSRAEALAGNPSGTGGAILSASQVVGTIRQLGNSLFGAAAGSIAGTSLGMEPVLSAAVGSAISLGAPWAIAKGTTTEAGINFLMRGLGGKYSRPALKFAAGVLSNKEVISAGTKAGVQIVGRRGQ